MKKIIQTSDLKNIISNLRKKNKIIVFTNGCFDILHIGHVRYLKDAKKLGDILIVGVNSDKSVKIIKGALRPITTENDRAEILSSLYFVDYVIIFDEQIPYSLINLIKPDIHVKGGDYTIDKIPESELVKKLGGKTVILRKTPERSSTNIINKILNHK